jgi:RNA polymerase-binding transcription factor DksA
MATYFFVKFFVKSYNSHMLNQEFIDEMKQALEAKKLELAEELAGLSPHTELGDDYEGNAQEVQLDEVSQDVMAVLKSDLEKIDSALQKIADGTYGTDSDGREISEARLRVIPWADKAI